MYNPLVRYQPEVEDGDPGEEGSHPPPERPEPAHHQERHPRQRRRGAAGRHLHRGNVRQLCYLLSVSDPDSVSSGSRFGNRIRIQGLKKRFEMLNYHKIILLLKILYLSSFERITGRK